MHSPCCGAVEFLPASVTFELLAGGAGRAVNGLAGAVVSHRSQCRSMYAACNMTCLYSHSRSRPKKGNLKSARMTCARNQSENSEHGASSSVAMCSQNPTTFFRLDCRTVVCQCPWPCCTNQSFIISMRAVSASVASSPQASATAVISSAGMRARCFEHHWSRGKSP